MTYSLLMSFSNHISPHLFITLLSKGHSIQILHPFLLISNWNRTFLLHRQLSLLSPTEKSTKYIIPWLLSSLITSSPWASLFYNSGLGHPLDTDKGLQNMCLVIQIPPNLSYSFHLAGDSHILNATCIYLHLPHEWLHSIH